MSILSILGKHETAILSSLIIIPITGQMLHFYLDSPATTSATKYTVYNRSGSGGSIGINNYGIGGDGSTRSTILLQEIAQ